MYVSTYSEDRYSRVFSIVLGCVTSDLMEAPFSPKDPVGGHHDIAYNREDYMSTGVTEQHAELQDSIIHFTPTKNSSYSRVLRRQKIKLK